MTALEMTTADGILSIYIDADNITIILGEDATGEHITIAIPTFKFQQIAKAVANAERNPER